MVGFPRSTQIAGTVIGLAVLLLLLVVTGIGGQSCGETFIVDDDAGPGGDGSMERPFNSLAEALDASDWRDTILLYEGTYSGNVQVRESVRIYGNGTDATIIEGGEIEVLEDEVLISDLSIVNGSYGIRVDMSYLEIRNVSIRDTEDDGIDMESSAGYGVIHNCSVIGGKVGIRIEGPANRITDCSISNAVTGIFVGEHGTETEIISTLVEFSDKGLHMLGEESLIRNSTCSNNSWNGILLGSDSTGISMIGNTCTGSERGIELENTISCTAQGNTLEGNEYGFYIIEGRENIVRENQILENVRGAMIRRSNENMVEMNFFTDNGIGLYLFNGSQKNSIQENRFVTNSESGIHIRESNGNILTGNLIQKNDHGLIIEGGSRNMVIEGNDLIENIQYGLNAIFNDDWVVTASNNYWGDYSGANKTGDLIPGTGDRASVLVDKKPWSYFPHTFTMERCRVNGTVREIHGPPIGNVSVRFTYHRVERTVITNEDGSYESMEFPCENDGLNIVTTGTGYKRYDRTVTLGGDTEVLIELLRMTTPISISVEEPREGGEVFRFIGFSGTVLVDSWDDPRIIVQLQVDDGAWVNMTTNMTFWFEYATDDLNEGDHEFRIRATDGWYHSEEIQINLYVKKEDTGRFDWMNNWIIVTIVILILSIGTIILAQRFLTIMESWYKEEEKGEENGEINGEGNGEGNGEEKGKANGEWKQKVEHWEIDSTIDHGIRAQLKERLEARKEAAMEKEEEEGTRTCLDPDQEMETPEPAEDAGDQEPVDDPGETLDDQPVQNNVEIDNDSFRPPEQ